MAKALDDTAQQINIAGGRMYLQERSLSVQPVEVQSISDIEKGDHIVHCVTNGPYRPAFQSALVIELIGEEVVTICNTVNGVQQITKAFSSFNFMHKIVYSESDSFDGNEAIRRANCRKDEHRYDALNNNSHHFVTLSKCGIECSLSDTIQNVEDHVLSMVDDKPEYSNGSSDLSSDEDEYYDVENAMSTGPISNETSLVQGDEELDSEEEFSLLDHSNLVLRKKEITNVASIKPGDHITNKSKHWIAESYSGSQFTGYTYMMGKIVIKTVTVAKDFYRITYPENCTISAESTLLRARKHVQQRNKFSFSSSDRYVTKMKCGREYALDDCCLINADARAVGCTRISCDVNIAEGDHLLIKVEQQFTSVIVCAITGKSSISVVPDLHGKFLPTELSFHTQDEVYRVNYDEHLPPYEIVRRVLSDEGKRILQKGHGHTSLLATWATIGKMMDIQPNDLIHITQLKHITPTCYKCVTSLSEIHPGDHLFVQRRAYRWHFMVTECRSNSYKVVYFLRGVFRETIEELDLKKGNVFKIFYNEQFPAEKAIANARSHVAKKKVSAFCRTEFIPMVKTGSNKGLEVDFLTDLSVPASKDTVSCFSQVEAGDYVVVEYGRFSYYYRHCLIMEVHSPDTCEVIEISEHTSLRPRRKGLDIEECRCCYRINYCVGVCRPVRESLELAKEFEGNLWRSRNRSFVNYLKTGNLTHEVEVDQLQNKRLCLKRVRVTNAMDLKVGDHIERPLNLSKKTKTFVPFVSNKMHHMLVTKPIDETHCKVIEAHVKRGIRKSQPRHHEISIFDNDTNNVFRVVYAERIDPVDGIQRCLKECSDKNLESEARNSDNSAALYGDDEGQTNPLLAQFEHRNFTLSEETLGADPSIAQESDQSDGKECSDKNLESEARNSDRYHLIWNNCEHVVMLGTIGRKESIQISVQLHKELQEVYVPIRDNACMQVRDSVTRSISNGVLKASGDIAVGVALKTTAKAATKGGISGSVTEATETLTVGATLSNTFRVGYQAATNGVSVGLVSGVAGAVNLGIEGTLLTRGVYKLKRQKKFNRISEAEYKRGVTKQAFTRLNTFLGATGGAIVGQVAIPVPIAGAVVGGVIGTVAGRVAGYLEGELASKLIKEKDIELPVTVYCVYTNY